MLYFTSPPMSPLASFERGGLAFTSLVRFDVTYGLISTFFDRGGASRPTSVAAYDICMNARCHPNDTGMRVRNANSFFRWSLRSRFRPQTWLRPGR